MAKAMAEMHEQGRKDALRALAINSKFVPAYLSLLDIERAGGTLENSARIAEIGTSQLPQSYYVRIAFMQALLPRWGGSYEAMNFYASKEQAHLGKSARIYALLGEVPADKARILSRQGEHQKAIDAATEALSYGERMAHLELRAKAYVALGLFDLAAIDFRRMVAIDPADDASKSKADIYEKMPRLLIEKK